jgi:hypothetical protein
MPTAGVRLWWNTEQENTVWVEQSAEVAHSFLAETISAKESLRLLPPPFGRLATAMSARRIRELQTSLGSEGLWLKFDLSGLIGVRPRTGRNKLRPPSPW